VPPALATLTIRAFEVIWFLALFRFDQFVIFISIYFSLQSGRLSPRDDDRLPRDVSRVFGAEKGGGAADVLGNAKP
jgi:hypothetical protein